MVLANRIIDGLNKVCVIVGSSRVKLGRLGSKVSNVGQCWPRVCGEHLALNMKIRSYCFDGVFGFSWHDLRL